MKRIKNSIGILWLVLGFAAAGCMTKQEAGPARAQDPVLDFIALAEFGDNQSAFSQVLLRMELLHTTGDLLQYGLQTPEEHQARLGYYRTRFKEDVFLVSGADTIPCYDLHAERMYMDLPYMNFILTFQHPIRSGDRLLISDIVYTRQTVLLDIDPKIQ